METSTGDIGMIFSCQFVGWIRRKTITGVLGSPRRGVRSTVGDRQSLDADDPIEPPIQVASVAAAPAVLLDADGPAALTEDTVVVMDEEPGSRAISRRLPDLLLHPR